MALNFGQNLFPGRSYLEGEEGYRAVVDIDGNLNVSGAVSFPAAQSVFFDTAQMVWFSGAQTVEFASAQDVSITGTPTVDIDSQNVYAIQSGAYVTTTTIDNAYIDVAQSGAWTSTIANAYMPVSQSGAWTTNIAEAYIPVSQSGAWTQTIDNAYIDVAQSGAWTQTIDNAYLTVQMSGGMTVDNSYLTVQMSGGMTVEDSYLDVNISGATFENNTMLSDWKWLTDNGTLIVSGGTAVNTTKTVYTVPSGKAAYLFAGDMSFITGTPGEESRVEFLISDVRALGMETPNANNAHNHAMISLPVPIKLASGATVKIKSALAAIAIEGNMIAYEVSV